MIRYGTTRADYHTRPTTALSLHALCLSAIQHDLRVCRIPTAYIGPLAESSAAPLRDLLQAYAVRLVVHAPMSTPLQLEGWFGRAIAFFGALDAPDALIVCHLPRWSVSECMALQRLPDWIRRHLAIELTDQPVDTLIERLAPSAIPIVFDTLHYQQQAPWPYEPIPAMFRCLDTWGERTPLLHLSTQATALRANAVPPPRGMHSDVLDTTTALWFIRALLDTARSVDIEIEANSGVVAYTHLQHALRQSMQGRRGGAVAHG